MGNNAPVNVQIVDSDSHSAAYHLEGLAGVLIFGSSTKPGGGWLNGAKAQEEDISLASTWGEQARRAPAGFYGSREGLGGVGPDKALIAEGLWLRTPAGGVPEAPRRVIFAGVAAPNLTNPDTAGLPAGERCDRLARRLAAALAGWADAGVQTVVMGAIGCGVFQWEGADSARALRLALNHHRTVAGSLPHVVLAMPDARLAQAFQTVLAAPATKARHTP
jgi:uncharacterized protein (TIGR02452 family)